MGKNTSPCRAEWVAALDKIARPVLGGFCTDDGAKSAIDNCRQSLTIRLKDALPQTKAEKARGVAYLEAIGRTAMGLSAWLELPEKEISCAAERALQAEYRALCRAAMAAAANPQSPDYCVWNKTGDYALPDQPLVDAAFFASALLKAPEQLWNTQPQTAKQNILTALSLAGKMRPHRNNWLMFAATIEAAKFKFSGTCDLMRIDYAFTKHNDWYKGGGVYGDGEHFAADYYNSYVIHPMLHEVAQALGGRLDACLTAEITPRLQKYCEILERTVAPDGSYPPLGRSVVYRAAAFHALSYAALKGILPKSLSAGQVRCALDKVIKKMMSAQTLFDGQGFITKGLFGKQDGLAEDYINTGSLYLCSTVFLPLGLPSRHPFWCSSDEPITWERLWAAPA